MQDLKDIYQKPEQKSPTWIYVVAFILLCVAAFFFVDLVALPIMENRQ